MKKNHTIFYWLATECAPKHYPMEIIKGIFIYHGEQERGLYVPSGGTLHAGWGRAISNDAVGPDFKPLPDHLKIIFFSYAEKQFYKGDFKLPYEKILDLFRLGVAENKNDPIYNRIMVGVAPGGVVSVWVKGEISKEIFFGQAEKIDMDPSAAFSLPFDSKAQSDKYIQENMDGVLTKEELASIKKHGVPFGLWARYRRRYQWLPELTDGFKPVNFGAIFLNGENIREWHLRAGEEPKVDRPVPKRVSFETEVNGEDEIFIIHLNPLETMNAFEKLGKDGQNIFMEIHPRLPKEHASIRLYNKKESIELKKTVSEEW